MANTFEAKPDARQTTADEIETSRFRPRYRQLSDDELILHDALKGNAMQLERVIKQIKPGRYQSLAFTALEEAVMWAVKGLTE